MKKLIFLFIISFSFADLYAQADMKTQFILNGRVSISLPADFKEEAASENNPASWQSKDGKAILLYRLQEDSVTDNDMPAFLDDQIKLAKQDDPGIKYLDDGIHLQDGKNIPYLKMSSEEFGKKYFNYMFFISVNDKPLALTFMCPLKLRSQWEPVVDKIANSLRIVQ